MAAISRLFSGGGHTGVHRNTLINNYSKTENTFVFYTFDSQLSWTTTQIVTYIYEQS